VIMEEVLPGLRANLETVVSKSWANDPFQRGAYTVYHVGQMEWYHNMQAGGESVVCRGARLSIARVDGGRDRVGN